MVAGRGGGHGGAAVRVGRAQVTRLVVRAEVEAVADELAVVDAEAGTLERADRVVDDGARVDLDISARLHRELGCNMEISRNIYRG